MTEQNNYQKGSIWRKWDLHVHTPKTFLANEYAQCSTEQFVNKIVDSGIAAIGLTNYFHFDDVELGEIRNKLTEKGVVVFPSLEFRTQPQNKDSEEMHIHLLFSDKISSEVINSFLGRLKTVDDKYCKNLSQEEIKSTFITFDTLKNTLKNDTEIKHLKDYLLVACPRGAGSFRPSKDDDGRGKNLAVTIDKNTDILFGNESDQDFFLNPERYENAFPKPVLKCADAHKLDKIGSAFTWIKADVNFEGLKQIICEPKDRVKIQERNPSDSKSKRICIDYISYKHSSGNENKVCFNDDLNSIIGARGKGKSTLLKNIVSRIDPEQFGKKDKNLYLLDGFKIIWADGKEDSDSVESPKNVFYIPQGYLSSLVYDDGDRARERDEFLTELLKKNAKFANAIQTHESFISGNKVKIESLIQDLIISDEGLRETKVLLKKQGAKAEIEKEVKEKNQVIKQYNESSGLDITEDEISNYAELKRTIENDTQRVIVLTQDKTILDNLKKTGASVYVSNNEFDLLSSERQESIKSKLIEKGNKNLIDLINEEARLINNEITGLDKRIKEGQANFNALNEKIKKSKALGDLTAELSTLQKTLEKIKELSSRQKRLESARSEAIKGLVNAYNDFDIQQQAIYSTINFEREFSVLQVEIVATYNTQQLKDFVERNINTRDTDAVLKAKEYISNLFNPAPNRLTGDEIGKVINDLMSGGIKIKVDAYDVATVISQLLKNRYEIDYLNSVKTKGTGTCFKDMTGGEKAITLLELIFRFNDEQYPILIDQPEDDLDISGVAIDLVDFIKSEKQKRQIIIVSHNASLVICADTENVIVSSNTRIRQGKYDFSYLTGAIENAGIRDSIIKVLEGGKNALEKRIRKLDFKYEK